MDVNLELEPPGNGHALKIPDCPEMAVSRIDYLDAIQVEPDSATPPEPAPVAPPVRTLKIAIVGRAASFDEAPFDDPSWEIWTVSNVCQEIPRWTRHFEIHEIEPRKLKWGAYWEYLKQDHPGVIYLRELHPEVPKGIVYPKEEIVQHFGNYFNNSVSWMIALAMGQAVTDLALFGIDMAQDDEDEKSEYAHQRPSCEYFLGMAKGYGVNVTLHHASSLLKTRVLYGFDAETNAMRLKHQARVEDLKKQLAQYRQQKAQAICNEHTVLGAIEDMKYWRQWL